MDYSYTLFSSLHTKPGHDEKCNDIIFFRSKNRLVEFSTILGMSLMVYLAVNVQSEQADQTPTIPSGIGGYAL